MLNLIFLTSDKIHCLRNILSHSFSLIICKRGGEKSEHKIRFEGDGDVKDGNDDKYFTSLFHVWYYNPISISSLCLLAQF